ncbi:cytochrome P450 [Thelephora terrestris]|uniref:Cytochrome P450 n=1 Tax=Thelephora terrestris TaxID=56493 RepID=A0A9P6HCX6_9AGAM|nr:cytochrome P450 [Thelephora terrestris]
MYKFCILPAVLLSLYLYRRWRQRSLSDIPGPKSPSFLLGHLGDLLRKNAAEAEFLWQEQFGGVARIKAPFGEDQLWISDPKAIHHVLQTSCYKHPRPADRREFSRLVCDDGVLTMEGDAHKRHRKAMQPAFGMTEARELYPVFQEVAVQLVAKWKELITSDESDMEQSSSDMNVAPWLSRATLDVSVFLFSCAMPLVTTAFDYDFKALDGPNDPLVRSYENFLKNASGTGSSIELLIQSCFQYLPECILAPLVANMPGEAMSQMRENQKIVHGLARGWIADKAHALEVGKGHRDIMTLLVKANSSQDPKTRLSEYEMISQIRTILLAGHETTSNSMSFILWELTKHQDVQACLRREIESARAANDGAPFTAEDIDSMQYLQAVVKEVFRFHAPVYHIMRRSGEDDVLPLFEPIKTKSGTLITDIPVPEGTTFVLSFAAYNRNKKIWGNDADVFRPERWLEENERAGPNVGGYCNLLTFGAGPRRCIVSQHYVLELQTLLVELISNFEFSMTEQTEQVRRMPCAVMVPVVTGEEAKGVQMPLKVSLAPVN